jgi:hypothetical protein
MAVSGSRWWCGGFGAARRQGKMGLKRGRAVVERFRCLLGQAQVDRWMGTYVPTNLPSHCRFINREEIIHKKKNYAPVGIVFP